MVSPLVLDCKSRRKKTLSCLTIQRFLYCRSSTVLSNCRATYYYMCGCMCGRAAQVGVHVNFVFSFECPAWLPACPPACPPSASPGDCVHAHASTFLLPAAITHATLYSHINSCALSVISLLFTHFISYSHIHITYMICLLVHSVDFGHPTSASGGAYV